LDIISLDDKDTPIKRTKLINLYPLHKYNNPNPLLCDDNYGKKVNLNFNTNFVYDSNDKTLYNQFIANVKSYSENDYIKFNDVHITKKQLLNLVDMPSWIHDSLILGYLEIL